MPALRTTDEISRKPHAVLDLASRRLKAIKIERLLDLSSRPQPIRMLEIGTGSGGIAHYFATHPTLRIDVYAIDVVDSRLVDDAYHFQRVCGTDLPFEDCSFDVVLTNHVIEHVGGHDTQRAHLREIGRVLRDEGIGYLAVPNRWMVVEPHYRLAFLSWWPRAWRSSYLKWRRGIEFYDCEPLTLRQVEHLLGENNFEFKNLCVPALRLTLELEHSPREPMRLFLDRVPDWLPEIFLAAIPTLIYKFSKPQHRP